MSLTRFMFPGLVLGLVLSLVPSVAKAVPVSGVVLGNLGASGTDLTDVSDTNIIINTAGSTASSVNQLAQGFNTGTSGFGAANSLLLKSVSTVFGNPGASPLSVTAKLYSSNAGNPNALLQTSVAASVAESSGANLYTFDFANFALTASTQYWVVFDQAVAWYQVQDAIGNGVNPTIQNALSPATNNFSYLGSRRKNGLGNWSPSGSNYGAGSTASAFSVNVVPEPSTYAMAGIGAGLVGLARLRRRVR